jgi:hypothetical protein
MMTNTNPMTAQIPSTFGMPAYGCAPAASTTVRSAVVAVAPRSVVAGESSAQRDREIAFAGELGLGRATFTGTTAWRPPIC